MPTVQVVSYSIYHSANSYLGLILVERGFAGLPVEVERRPLCVPKAKGHLVAHLTGGAEGGARASYNREDCRRWADRYGITLNLVTPEVFAARVQRWRDMPLGREELAARAYYAAVGSRREAELDCALYRASYVDMLDVNEESVVRRAAVEAGLDADALLQRALGEEMGARVMRGLEEFERAGCPGVPTWTVGGERFWGKDRVDWLVDRVRQLAGA